MKNHQKLSKGLALAGGLAACSMAGLATPVSAASSATPQGNPIAVATGTLQFDSSGTSITSGYTLSSSVSARSEDGSFVSAWKSSVYDNSASNVYAHRFNADGTSGGNDILVNQTLAAQGSEIVNLNPSVAADSSGNFVVAWESQTTSQQTVILKARLFGADGKALSGEICIDPACTPTQDYPTYSVAMQTNGNFTVGYTSHSSDGSGALYFRRFAKDGTPLDAQPVTVYSKPGNFSLAMNRNNGNFSFGIDAQVDTGVYPIAIIKTSVLLRRYNASGSPLGLLTNLGNCSAANFIFEQAATYGCIFSNASIGSDADGNITLLWEKDTYSGSLAKSQTYMRHYHPSGLADGAKVTIDPTSLLAQGFAAEDGAGDLITSGSNSFQVFNNKGAPLGDAIPSVQDINVSTDTSSNFVTTGVIETNLSTMALT